MCPETMLLPHVPLFLSALGHCGYHKRAWGFQSTLCYTHKEVRTSKYYIFIPQTAFACPKSGS